MIVHSQPSSDHEPEANPPSRTARARLREVVRKPRATFREALAAALGAAHVGLHAPPAPRKQKPKRRNIVRLPGETLIDEDEGWQPGNSERGSQLVAEARLASLGLRVRGTGA